MKTFVLVILLAALPVRADLHEKVVATYNFLPRNLDAAAIDVKSDALDRFWSDVKALGKPGLEQLRAELRREDAPVFFRYDGAKLLLSLSTERDDEVLALRSISRADLRDLQAGDYFYTVHRLAVKGHDTTDAAFNILSDPTFSVFVPQHVLTLVQSDCLAYMLLPTNESFYVSRAIERLFVEKDRTARQSLIRLLSLAVTTEADEALARFAKEREDTEVAELVRQIGMEQQRMRRISTAGYAPAKKKRREAAARVSDEALFEIEQLTLVMRRNQGR